MYSLKSGCYPHDMNMKTGTLNLLNLFYKIYMNIFSIGEYCEVVLDQPCPTNWWGYPVCGPCHCNVDNGYDRDCNKTTGECRCEVRWGPIFYEIDDLLASEICKSFVTCIMPGMLLYLMKVVHGHLYTLMKFVYVRKTTTNQMTRMLVTTVTVTWWDHMAGLVTQ